MVRFDQMWTIHSGTFARLRGQVLQRSNFREQVLSAKCEHTKVLLFPKMLLLFVSVVETFES